MNERIEELTNECWQACYHEGDIEKVAELLSLGVDINQRAPTSGAAPLDAAIWGNHISLVNFLVREGADVNGVGYDHFTPLMAAANQGLPEVLQLLLDNHADPNLASPVSGETPLHAATAKGFAPRMNAIVATLLSANANPNVKTVVGAAGQTYVGGSVRLVGETPLHLAAAFGDGEMIRMLVDAGADITAKDADGYTPFNWFGRHQRSSPHVMIPHVKKVWKVLKPS